MLDEEDVAEVARLEAHLGRSVSKYATPKRILADDNLTFPSIQCDVLQRNLAFSSVDLQIELDARRVGVCRLTNNVKVLIFKCCKVGSENLVGIRKRGAGRDATSEMIVRCGV
ncbi:hypothetical protein AG1IA_06717 [Rhizoctonia solani AG-1 IA]|uniref:Uncharacterized protein n=1 Tax=Thanatephorus cucumeris (strain AG1-IA) TaxID=983506 RepID=L8WMS8_THACA|nr:hypothetical protein AG1IA_06717 [Rhizoctonia solani AG-1 IA]